MLKEKTTWVLIIMLLGFAFIGGIQEKNEQTKSMPVAYENQAYK